MMPRSEEGERIVNGSTLYTAKATAMMARSEEGERIVNVSTLVQLKPRL